jgi:hypothetical protein
MRKNRVLTSQTVSDKGKLWDKNARGSAREVSNNIRIFFSVSQCYQRCENKGKRSYKRKREEVIPERVET